MEVDVKDSGTDDHEMKDESNDSFIPEINERSRQIAERLRVSSILDLYDTISDGSDVIDLMSFQCSSVKTQMTLTHHQKLAIQYFIPYAIKKATKMEVEDVPESKEKLIDLVRRQYSTCPVLVELNNNTSLYFTRNGFLETMLLYLKLPSGKKFPIPIKFETRKKVEADASGNSRNSNSNSNSKIRNNINNTNSKVTGLCLKKEKSQHKNTVGPQMNRAIENYLKKKKEQRDKDMVVLNEDDSKSHTDPECTFQPKMIKTLYEKCRGKFDPIQNTKNDECMNIIKKFLLLDNNDKDEKMESYFKSIQECTFQPNIDKYINDAMALKEKSIKKKSKENLTLNNNVDNKKSNDNGELSDKNESNTEATKEQILIDNEKKREELVNKLIQEEWDRNVELLFDNEYNLKYSSLVPIEEIMDSDCSCQEDGEVTSGNRNDKVIYDWETHERGPIYNRSLRQRLRQKADNKVVDFKVNENNKGKKKYTPPYKWHEDLRSENDKYALEPEKRSCDIKTNKNASDEIQQFGGIRWERYIRLRDRHIKSIPIFNYKVVNKLDEGIEAKEFSSAIASLNGIYDVGAPVTVVGVRENIIKYLEKELSNPIPDLFKLCQTSKGLM